MPDKSKRSDPKPERAAGYWECAQHGVRCCAYSGAEANEWNRKGKTPKEIGSRTWGCRWIPGRSLTVEEMDAREAYWTSFGAVDNIKEARR